MVRVGLIGFGLAGQAFHAPMIRGIEGMELACVLERHTSNAQQRYPNVRIARTLDEMLSDKSINLCVVATPNDSHFSYTKACLEADRDVVVDKPITPTMAEAEELVALAEKRGRLISVYQDRRYDGAYLTVKKLINTGELGEVAEYEARFDRFRLDAKAGAWREKADFPAAGVLGPRAALDRRRSRFIRRAGIDLRRGPPPAQIVYGRRCIRCDPPVPSDSRQPSRTHYRLRARTAPASTRYKRIVYKVRMDPQEEILRSEHCPDGLDWGKNWGLEAKDHWGTLTRVGEQPRKVKTERGDYRGFYVNMRDAIEKKAPLAVPPDQFLRTQRALLLAHKSSKEKREVSWREEVS